MRVLPHLCPCQTRSVKLEADRNPITTGFTMNARTSLRFLSVALALGLCSLGYGAFSQPQNISALESKEIESLKLATFRRNPAGLDAPRFDFRDGVNFKVTAASLVDLIRYAHDRF